MFLTKINMHIHTFRLTAGTHVRQSGASEDRPKADWSMWAGGQLASRAGLSVAQDHGPWLKPDRLTRHEAVIRGIPSPPVRGRQCSSCSRSSEASMACSGHAWGLAAKLERVVWRWPARVRAARARPIACTAVRSSRPLRFCGGGASGSFLPHSQHRRGIEGSTRHGMAPATRSLSALQDLSPRFFLPGMPMSDAIHQACTD